MGVGWVQNARQRFRLVAFLQRANVVAGIEGVEQDWIDRYCRPQPQRVDALAAPADHRRVIGGCQHTLLRPPNMAGGTTEFVRQGFNRAAEADFDCAFTALEIPGIAVLEPGFWQFHLVAILDFLAEKPVYIADAIAMRRHVDGRHGFHEAGGQSAEAAIAECRIRLQFRDDVQIDIQRGERFAHLFQHAHVGKGIAHQAADQEFQRQVVNALAALPVGAFRGIDPARDDAIANHLDGSVEPIVTRRHTGVLADAKHQRLEDFVCEGARRRLRRDRVVLLWKYLSAHRLFQCSFAAPPTNVVLPGF